VARLLRTTESYFLLSTAATLLPFLESVETLVNLFHLSLQCWGPLSSISAPVPTASLFKQSTSMEKNDLAGRIQLDWEQNARQM
jgi:hypothetical protein